MLKTRTGEFAIGFRECFDDSISWAKENGFGVIDLQGLDLDKIYRARSEGLRIGSLDLPNPQGMITADREKRKVITEQSSEFIRASSAGNPTNYFVVAIPEDPSLERKENFEYMVEGFGGLKSALEESDSHLVIEGWPGPGVVCSTTEVFRAFFNRCPNSCFGINYDPSHLIRLGIDPLRFLVEFSDRVFHVHAKDTEIQNEGVYEYGWESPATFAEKIRYGGYTWRYTVPGYGDMRWWEGFRILIESGYRGAVSIEMEDANFSESTELIQEGLRLGGQFLTGC